MPYPLYENIFSSSPLWNPLAPIALNKKISCHIVDKTIRLGLSNNASIIFSQSDVRYIEALTPMLEAFSATSEPEKITSVRPRLQQFLNNFPEKWSLDKWLSAQPQQHE